MPRTRPAPNGPTAGEMRSLCQAIARTPAIDDAIRYEARAIANLPGRAVLTPRQVDRIRAAGREAVRPSGTGHSAPH